MSSAFENQAAELLQFASPLVARPAGAKKTK
jgi:hypothetical protein